jgi:hypothetical protein
MAINTDDEFFIKINFIAILIIFVLADIMKELKEESEAQEIVGHQLKTNELSME